MHWVKFIPPQYLSRQARKPSGWFGRVLMSRIFNKVNADLNIFIKELLELEENDAVLEIGFGSGQLINQIAQITKKGFVSGIDFSDAMLAQACKANKKFISEKRVAIQKGNCINMPYPNEAFEKACTSNTVYFWENPKKNFKEIFRVLKKNGILVVGFRDRNQMEKLPFSKDIFSFYSAEEIKSLLFDSGFTDVSIIRVS